MKKKMLLYVLFIIFTLFNEVFADSPLFQNPISLTPIIGSVNINSDQDIKGSGIFGFHLGYMLNDTWGTDFVMETGEFSISYCDEFDCCHKDIHYNSYLFEVDIMNHLTYLNNNNVFPFLSGGIGAIYSDNDYVEHRSSPVMSMGLGAKCLFVDNSLFTIALRSDIKYTYSINDSNSYISWNIGFSFLFDKYSENNNHVHNNAKCPRAHKLSFSESYLNADGCSNDSDNDGIPDYIDACPDTKLNKSDTKSVNAIGCSHDGDGVVDDLLSLSLPVLDIKTPFQTNSSELLDKYHPILNELYDVIELYPDLKIEIQGHADNVGDQSSNIELSAKRAKAVQTYLLNKDPKRIFLKESNLRVKCFGYIIPEAPNDTPEGLQMNRRVTTLSIINNKE